MLNKKTAFIFCIVLFPILVQAKVILGVDNLLLHYTDLIRHMRIAVLTNQTGITADGRRTIDAIRSVPDVTLQVVFTPEHGLNGTAYAGQDVLSYFDSTLGVNVYSLYGPQRKPTATMLDGVDVIVYDIQDIGVRSYTFISTLGLMMQAAAEYGIPVIVLDRPCVLGMHVDGNVLDTNYRSFVGMYPVPYVYGMTVGEFAWMINDEGMNGAPCKLTVVPMLGWKHQMTWEQTGLQWIPTSPNIPVASTAAYYAAFGSIGELGIGEYAGIGSPDAFRVFAMPTFDRTQFQQLFSQKQLAGVQCVPYDTTVMNHKGPTHLEGVRFLLNVSTVKDISLVGLQLLSVLVQMHLVKEPDSAHAAMFAKISGGDYLQRILRGEPVEQIAQEWTSAQKRFMSIRKKYLLYP